VIRPDGDEVGVFLGRDALDLPYKPRTTVESDMDGSDNQRSEVRVRLFLTNRNAYFHLDTSNLY